MKKCSSLAILFSMSFIIGFLVIYATKPPKISVVMSTYNRADLLPNAIDSILNQTYKDFEFIIINDGSTDETRQILNAYAKKDRRIIVLDNGTNKGLVFSLNRGLDTARGTYIARMDDDDESLPDRFEIQTAYMDAHKDVTVLGTAVFLKNNKDEKKEYTTAGSSNPKETQIISYFQVPTIHPTTFIRHDFIKKHHIRYSSKYPSAEDTHFWYTIARNGGVIKNVIYALLIYNKSSQKFDGYSHQQARSYEAFVRESLAPFMDTKDLSWPPNPEQSCKILYHLEKAAETEPVDFDVETLKSLIHQRDCAKYKINDTHK